MKAFHCWWCKEESFYSTTFIVSILGSKCTLFMKVLSSQIWTKRKKLFRKRGKWLTDSKSEKMIQQESSMRFPEQHWTALMLGHLSQLRWIHNASLIKLSSFHSYTLVIFCCCLEYSSMGLADDGYMLDVLTRTTKKMRAEMRVGRQDRMVPARGFGLDWQRDRQAGLEATEGRQRGGGGTRRRQLKETSYRWLQNEKCTWRRVYRTPHIAFVSRSKSSSPSTIHPLPAGSPQSTRLESS